MSVIVERSGPVTVVTIDRPEVRNAVDRETAASLAAAFRDFDRDPDAAVAVLTGSDGTFCAGADLQAVSRGEANRLEPDGDGPMGPTRMRLGKPVVAAIEGYAVAGGLELALWADLRVAADDAVLGVFCRRWGVPLIDGGTVRLPRLIGESRAMDLVLTGRPVGAREALEIGLVNRVCPAGEARSSGLLLAEELAAFPQTCLRQDLRGVREQWGLAEGPALVEEFAQDWSRWRRTQPTEQRGSPAARGGTVASDPPGEAGRTPRRATEGPGGSVVRARARSVARAALRGDDVSQQLLDLGLAVAAVAAERPDGAQLAGLGPAGDRLRVHAEHGCHLSGREEGFCLSRSRYHGAPLLMRVSQSSLLLNRVCHRTAGAET